MLHGAWTSSHPVHLSCWALGTMRPCSTTNLNLIVLLCLGLCRGPQDLVQAGVLPKPSIWADPGPVVPKGSRVIIWCQGSLQAEVYRLYKEPGSQVLDTETPQDSSNKTSFLIESMSSTTAGRYQCAYYTRRNSLSERSDPLSLVVTGMYDAPSLSAQPSPVVASGEKVSLSCSSQSTRGAFHLLKDRGADQPIYMDSRINYGRRPAQAQALFPVGPVNTSHGGTYRCYGSSSSYPNVWSHPSKPLPLKVTGVYRKPTLSAQPGPFVLPGDNLTLQCHSEAGFDRFALTKDVGLTPTQGLDGQPSPDFPLGRVTRAHGGRYRCYTGHNLSYAWSAPSAPLDILITGLYEKPSLSAQPGPSVSRGENVTLQCRSETSFDNFHLHKVGSPAPPRHLRLGDTAAPSQANFRISPVTSAHGGTYRCYGSRGTSPYLLSHASDPLQLVVSESYPGFQKAHSLPSFGASESLWQKVQDLLLLGTPVHSQLVLSPQTTTAIIWRTERKAGFLHNCHEHQVVSRLSPPCKTSPEQLISWSPQKTIQVPRPPQTPKNTQWGMSPGWAWRA
ncbi:leukocyte immunoglobulin-like receptor subfamily A member 3 isoform X5 [Rhinolophus ferrumequinum]|uniref:leukocyte immunoglobulin-like receptor subfamily A member 3 isoform X5 n=1 Tax=Rhinolophus ferrumequinum TaxID=59479 RepID=UPI00140FD663|nr:leukocyte immunoglobulin-like receptor subfamily A member 3 isoform X5 [Rhinolophus ferrumequinum]